MSPPPKECVRGSEAHPRSRRHIQDTLLNRLTIEVFGSQEATTTVAYLVIPGFGSRYITTGPRRICQLVTLAAMGSINAPRGSMEGVDWGHDTSGLYEVATSPLEALEAIHARVTQPPVWDDAMRPTLDAWISSVGPPTVVMNRAHRALSDDNRGLSYAWPMGGPGEALPWPSTDTLRHFHHRIGPRYCRLIVVTPSAPETVLQTAKTVFGSWAPAHQVPPSAWVPTPVSRRNFGFNVPWGHSPQDQPGVWVGLMLPMEGMSSPASHAGNFLTRLPLRHRAAFWPHPEVSVGILWGDGTGANTRGGVDLVESLLDIKAQLLFGKMPGMNAARAQLIADNAALERNALGMARYLASRTLYGWHVPSMRVYERRGSTEMAMDLRQLIVGAKGRASRILIRGQECARGACHELLRQYEREHG